MYDIQCSFTQLYQKVGKLLWLVILDKEDFVADEKDKIVHCQICAIRCYLRKLHLTDWSVDTSLSRSGWQRKMCPKAHTFLLREVNHVYKSAADKDLSWSWVLVSRNVSSLHWGPMVTDHYVVYMQNLVSSLQDVHVTESKDYGFSYLLALLQLWTPASTHGNMVTCIVCEK